MAVVGKEPAKQTLADSATELTPLQMMEQARREHEAQEAARKEAERQAYFNSPAGQLETKIFDKLPSYQPRGLYEKEERGGFLTTEFDVVGLPASITHKFVPRDMLQYFTDIWKPFPAEDATMYESEVASGKVFIPRAWENVKGMVCTGQNLSELVMVVASREAVEAKISDKTQRWNDRFERTAPSGQYDGRMASGETGREFMVSSENFAEAQLSGQLLAAPEEGEVNA